MKKITAILVFALIMGVLAPLAAFAAAPETVVVTDEAGNRVEVPKKLNPLAVSFHSLIGIWLGVSS